MQYIKQTKSINIIGIKTRTGNDKASEEIPPHWEKFFSEGIADKIPMKQHTKPAVIIGSAMFEKDIVDEIIDETERLRESGDNAGGKLIGQLKNNEKSKQVSFDMENEVGVLLKQVFDAIGDRYLQEMLKIGARADCYEIWTNHAFAGDYNPIHTHGSYSPLERHLGYIKVKRTLEFLQL